MVWVGHQGARPKLENLKFLCSSSVFVGTRIEEYTFCTATTILLWWNTFLFYLSPYKKKDNPNLVTTNHRVLPNLTRSNGMVLCPNYLVQLVPVINDWSTL